MARRARVTPTRLAAALHPGVRRVAAGIEPLHRGWAQAARDAAASTGPLHVVLGDSTVVGVGASDLGSTCIALVGRHLHAVTGRPWRCVNLGRHGAKLATVLDDQVVRMHGWGTPTLVTVGAGANDVLWSRGLPALLDRLERLLDALPAGAVVGTLPPGWAGKGLHANVWLRAAAAERSLRVAEVGVLPLAPPMVAADGVHPNDAGHRFIADGIIAALSRGPSGPGGPQLRFSR